MAMGLIAGLLGIIATLSCVAFSPSAPSSELPCPDCPLVPVDRVIDGDTFDSGNEVIRLFGADTPERDDNCFAEATDRLQELAGESVRVEPGPRQADRYGRSLYYV
jgi:endonuclease YncB( thermonuclease family)